MSRYLIDVPTLTTVWVTARNKAEAIASLAIATKNLDLDIPIGTDENPIDLVDFTCRGAPEIIEIRRGRG